MNALQPVTFAHVPVRDPRISEKYVPGKHSKRFWTEAEDAVIRTHYPEGGAGACLVHMPGRSITKIYARANVLGIRGNVGGKGRPKRTFASPEMDERIREEWSTLDGRKKGAVLDLAHRLGVPRDFVTRRATAMGLVIPNVRKEPNWSASEDALMRQVPLHDPEKAARIFKDHGFPRTASAIMVRAKRLELSRRDTREQLSATKAAKILGIDAKGVTSWILSGDLVAKKRDDKRTAQQGGSSWDIEPADLRRFILDKLEFVDFRKVDKFALVDLLVAPVPKTRSVSVRGWTDEQDETFRRMWAAGESIDSIGIAIGKTWTAVNSRRTALRLERRTRPWTEEDAIRIRTLFVAGAADDEIAQELGLKVLDVKNRRAHMGLKRIMKGGAPESARRAEILRLRSEGVSVRNIASSLRVTTSWVYQVLASEAARASA